MMDMSWSSDRKWIEITEEGLRLKSDAPEELKVHYSAYLAELSGKIEIRWVRTVSLEGLLEWDKTRAFTLLFAGPDMSRDQMLETATRIIKIGCRFVCLAGDNREQWRQAFDDAAISMYPRRSVKKSPVTMVTELLGHEAVDLWAKSSKHVLHELRMGVIVNEDEILFEKM